MQNKICTKCNIEYPVTKEYFYKDKRGKNGLTSQCKKCYRAFTIKYYQKHKKEYKELRKKYRQTLRGYIAIVVGAIKHRCTNPKNPSYKHYGERGIKCKFTSAELYNWLIDKDIDPRGLCIHRIDNDGNYTLENITFMDRSMHMKLHRSNTL